MPNRQYHRVDRLRIEMLKVFIFFAAAIIGLSITIETPRGPEANTYTDFDPATQAEILQANLLVHATDKTPEGTPGPSWFQRVPYAAMNARTAVRTT
jgi:hypothetical protein